MSQPVETPTHRPAGAPADRAVLRTLAAQEVRNYLRHKVFWVGAALWALLCGVGLTGSDADYSTTGDGLGTAMALGVFGIVVMAGLVRRSDRAAAAGAVVVPERTRTLALAAAAVVVPGSMALVWFVCAAVGYQLDPPSPGAAPFGDHSTLDVMAAMFAEGVVPCVGGPLLGLVLARWWPTRGVAPLVAVLVVLATVVLQPLFTWAERPRLLWVWIHFYAPGGVDGDPERMVAYPGSPYLYVGYQVALCVLGVLVAVYHDRDADRRALRRRIALTGAVALLLAGTSYAVGPQDSEPSPVPSPSASR